MVKAGWFAPDSLMVGERNAEDEGRRIQEARKAREEQKRIRARMKAKRAKRADAEDGWGFALALTAHIAILPLLAAVL